jgi:hypothetical protein
MKQKFSELMTLDDPEDKHLKLTRFEEISQELVVLQTSKKDDVTLLANLIKYGNPIINLITVDSYLSPRHIRWTILFIDMLLIWFFTGMYFKNTRSIISVLSS